MTRVYTGLYIGNISSILGCAEIPPSRPEGPLIRLDSVQYTRIEIEIRPLGKQICKLHAGLIAPVCTCHNFYLPPSFTHPFMPFSHFQLKTKIAFCFIVYMRTEDFFCSQRGNVEYV